MYRSILSAALVALAAVMAPATALAGSVYLNGVKHRWRHQPEVREGHRPHRREGQHLHRRGRLRGDDDRPPPGPRHAGPRARAGPRAPRCSRRHSGPGSGRLGRAVPARSRRSRRCSPGATGW